MGQCQTLPPPPHSDIARVNLTRSSRERGSMLIRIFINKRYNVMQLCIDNGLCLKTIEPYAQYALMMSADARMLQMCIHVQLDVNFEMKYKQQQQGRTFLEQCLHFQHGGNDYLIVLLRHGAKIRDPSYFRNELIRRIKGMELFVGSKYLPSDILRHIYTFVP